MREKKKMAGIETDEGGSLTSAGTLDEDEASLDESKRYRENWPEGERESSTSVSGQKKKILCPRALFSKTLICTRVDEGVVIFSWPLKVVWFSPT